MTSKLESIFNRKANGGVTTKAAGARRIMEKASIWRKNRRWFLSGVLGVVLIAAGISVYQVSQPKFVKAPEAEVSRVLGAQEGLNFGVLVPTYMPAGFDRAAVELKALPDGSGGEPVVELTYRNKAKQTAIFMRQWVPVNPGLQTLVGSFPIETTWGKGFLANTTVTSLWVDVGQLRVQLATPKDKGVSKEQLLQMANSLGLVSEDQVYTFKMEQVEIRGIEPPPPVEIAVNSQGVQELNLTITPGGYSPVRFAVKKDIPVKINFRALGEVGCGNTLIMPINSDTTVGAQLTSTTDMKVVEFTPQQAGAWEFYCATRCYRGVLTVRE